MKTKQKLSLVSVSVFLLLLFVSTFNTVANEPNPPDMAIDYNRNWSVDEGDVEINVLFTHWYSTQHRIDKVYLYYSINEVILSSSHYLLYSYETFSVKRPSLVSFTIQTAVLDPNDVIRFKVVAIWFDFWNTPSTIETPVYKITLRAESWKGLTTGAIFGIAGGCAAVVVILTLYLYFRKKKKR